MMKNIFAKSKESGEIVNVEQVIKGDACNCICIKCGGALQARKGGSRQHHFKHIVGAECNPETILHKTAKKVFQEFDCFKLPEDKGYFFYSDVKEEQWLVNQKPDIILIGQDKNVHVEIAVTSFIDSKKEKKIIDSGYYTIEIDLSKLERDCSFEKLKTIIIEEIDRKELIYWGNDKEIDEENKNNKLTETLLVPFIFIVFTVLIWIGYKDYKNIKRNRYIKKRYKY